MSKKIALLLLVALVAMVACVQAQPSHPHHLVQRDQIFKAQPRYARSINCPNGGFKISQAPYQVSLQHLNRHVCGGSVLNNKWILTSAYCTKKIPVIRFNVRLGSSRHDSGGIVVQIKRIVEHPLYNGKFDYDFSLIELETELTFSDVVQPVALPEQDESVKDGTMAIVSGWGYTHSVNGSSAVLRAARLWIVSQKDCRYSYSRRAITDRMLCAGYQMGENDACHNDSGGPLVAEGKLVGVVCGCGLPGLPGVYGRVASVRDWVREISRV